MNRIKLFILQAISILSIAALLSASVPTGRQGVDSTQVFQPLADSYVSSQAPATNFGKLTRLQVSTLPVERSFLRFSINGLGGRRILSAVLRIYATSGANQALAVGPVTNTSWGETSITFANAPVIGSQKWSVPTVSAGTWVSFNVTGYVNHEGPYSFGLTTPGSARISLASRESISFIPQLVLTLGAADPVLVGAGDIADCGSTGDEATARLVNNIPGTVITLGDNAYEDGKAIEFANCYKPSWGAFKARTRPVPGNHDYHTPGAAPYYAYFGAAAGSAGKGYYSYNLGTWHIIALNSEINSAAGSPQEKWLRQDLAANASLCTLAYWHKPLFSSGASHGNNPEFKALWLALYQFHADVVLNGHEHNYERFAPQSPAGLAAPGGIREFVVGTGGKNHYSFGIIQPNSQVRNADTYGVLRLTLHPGSYEWKFIPVAGKVFADYGSSRCTP